MKHTDEAVDRVLAGLRSVDPPAGMERRLLRTLEQRAAASVHASEPSWRTASWILAGALTFVVLGIAVARSHPHAQPVPRALVTSPKPSMLVTKSQPTASPQTAPPQTASPQTAKHARSQALPRRAERRELSTESFPAPPMPLTEQERLLLRIAHSGDPVELAMLDPDVLELEQEQRKRDFLAFFPPPPVLTQPAPGDVK